MVVTKLDTCDFSCDRFMHIQSALLPFLLGCGFKEARLAWLPAVGPAGENLTAPPTDPRLMEWWQGLTVAQVGGAGCRLAKHGLAGCWGCVLP